MELISNYMCDDTYRHMLNELTRKTFWIDFESWVTNGYFEGDYIPYSYVDEGKIVSNVSVNLMNFRQNGITRNYIQLGTVMTDEDYRRQGLARKLMQYVIEKYENKFDGIYLFGNLDSVGFYEKMNFKVVNQFVYYVKDEFCHCDKIGDTFKTIKNEGDELKRKYMDIVRNSEPNSSFEQINKYGLQMFYTAEMDNVYYSGDLDCFIVLEQEDCLVLKSILSKGKVSLVDILKRLNIECEKCRLGFTPKDEDKDKCISEIYDGGDDYRLFYRGKELGAIEQDKLYFPELSHA